MKSMLVEDVMLSLDDVPTIAHNATLTEAVCVLQRAQSLRPPDRLPYRVVLVVNEQRQVVGKLGHLSFLQALEPGYEAPGERETLRRAGVDSVLAESISRHKRFWEGDLELACRRAAHLRVADVMRQVEESIDVRASLVEAICVLVRRGTLSILVRREDEVVGLLRLADAYEVVARVIANEGEASGGSAERE